MLGIGLGLTSLKTGESALSRIIALFIPSSSDSLVTADSLTFKVRT